MAQHNGYKTVGLRGSLAQLHPSSAPLKHDDDGMLPEWLVYHELTQTARTFISKVFTFYPLSPFHFCFAFWEEIV